MNKIDNQNISLESLRNKIVTMRTLHERNKEDNAVAIDTFKRTVEALPKETIDAINRRGYDSSFLYEIDYERLKVDKEYNLSISQTMKTVQALVIQELMSVTEGISDV